MRKERDKNTDNKRTNKKEIIRLTNKQTGKISGKQKNVSD